MHQSCTNELNMPPTRSGGTTSYGVVGVPGTRKTEQFDVKAAPAKWESREGHLTVCSCFSLSPAVATPPLPPPWPLLAAAIHALAFSSKICQLVARQCLGNVED